MNEYGLVLTFMLAGGLVAWLILSAPLPTQKKESASLSESMATVFGGTLGPTMRRRFPELSQDTDRQLELLGFDAPTTSGGVFLGTSVGWGVFAFLVMILFFMVVGMSALTSVSFAVIMGAILGLLHYRQLAQGVASRKLDLDREFPFFLDFIVMTKQAGATLPAAIELFVDAARPARLAGELDRVLRLNSKGPDGLVEALANYRLTCPSTAGQEAIMAITEAEPKGAEASETLQDLATDMRDRRLQIAETLAEALKSRQMLPATIMLVGFIIIVLAGFLPAILFGVQ